MKTLLVIVSLLALLAFAIYQMRIAFKTIKDSKINPPHDSNKNDTKNTDKGE